MYFRDRHDLVLKVVEHIGGELFSMSERWYEGTGDGPTLVREAIDGVVGVFAEHGPVLRALSDGVGRPARGGRVPRADPAVRGRDRAAHRGGDRGRADPAARATATALTWMMGIRTATLGRTPQAEVEPTAAHSHDRLACSTAFLSRGSD